MTSLLQSLRPVPGALARELKVMRLQGPVAREALIAILSVIVAVAIATMLQLDDLSWAAFSGFMVLGSGAARSLPRGVMRIAGTVAGATVGRVLAPAIASSPLLLVLALFTVSWIGTFRALASPHPYAWLFFGLTAGLVMTEALAAPTDTLHFAGTRIAEVVVGTVSCWAVAMLFAEWAPPAARTPVPPIPAFLSADWLATYRPLLAHSSRAALAVALLPLLWREFGISDFSQTAVTSYVVMIVPVAVVRGRQHDKLYERMAHRIAGCLLGSALAIATLGLFGDDLPAQLVVISLGIWVGYHVQAGHEGINYVGTQFVLGLLITLVQGPGPVISVVPGLERLYGVVIGSAALLLLNLVWPLPAQDPSTSG
ncbi:MAG TPA: FUSC family protein [Rhizomicrobium sp.]